MPEALDLNALSDEALLHRLSELTRDSRRVEADVVAHIGEADARRLYARHACSSMFDYCRQVLRLRENEAYLRITVARASREHPVLLAMLRDGRLHLSGIAKLARHLTGENRDRLLGRAAGMSHREVKELVRELDPLPDSPPTVRKLPEPLGAYRVQAPASPARPGSDVPLGGNGVSLTRAEAADPAPIAPAVRGDDDRRTADRAESLRTAPPLHPPTLEPLAPGRYRVQFTANAELRDKLEKLQALMRSQVPDGDLARLVELAVTEKLERLEARRFARTKAPRPGLVAENDKPPSRYIPATVRRVVHERDGGQCRYLDAQGHRCAKRHDLEFHHRKPFARGGEHSPEGLVLMCRSHNVLLAERDFGKEVMARYRRSGGLGAASASIGALRLAPERRARPPG